MDNTRQTNENRMNMNTLNIFTHLPKVANAFCKNSAAKFTSRSFNAANACFVYSVASAIDALGAEISLGNVVAVGGGNGECVFTFIEGRL